VIKTFQFGFFALIAAMLICVGAWSQPAGVQDMPSQVAHATKLKTDGNIEEARKLFEALLAQLRSRGPSPELTDVLNNLGDIANNSGQYDRAVELARESASVCRKMRNISCEAQALNDAGLAYSNGGKYSEAETEFEEALKLSTQVNDGRTMVLVLNNLGNLYYYEARYSEAFKAYDAASNVVEKANDAEWSRSWRAITRVNLATLYQRLGNDQRAINVYHAVLDNAHDLTPREVAHVLANLGVLYRRMGDIEEAIKNYHDAEKFYSQQKDIDGELGVVKNIGIAQVLDLGKLAQALKTFEQASKLAEASKNQRESMQALLYQAETLRRMGRFSDAKKDFETALALATQLGTGEEQWKALYALGRIALQDDRRDEAESKFRAAIQKIESLRSKLQLSRLKSDFLADKRDVYDALIKLLLERNDAPAALEFMERSRARVFQDKFFAAGVTPVSLTLASLQKRLDGQTALIEFWTGPDAIAAVWLTRDASGITQKNFSTDEMEKFARLVAGLPENLGDDWRMGFQKLAVLLPDGIIPFRGKNYEHLLIVPDGFLSMMPLELAPSDTGEALIEHHEFSYLPSAVLLLRGALQQSRSLGLPWQNQLVAFGDPAVVGNGESSVLASRNLPDSPNALTSLPSSGEEIRGIARMSAGRTRLYLRDSDRKPEFKQYSGSRAALLHVSTHAIADMDNPERSRLLFSPDQPGEPNNYLFLKELYDLDLRGVSLATLSACDTERGRLQPGEGVQAFSRALLAAGSRSALTTLWRVPDQPTSAFMQQFYYYLLKKHKTKAEALRLTKLEFLRAGGELAHPKFWAAFVLNGEGREPVPRFLPWQAIVAPLLLVFATVVVIVQLRKRRRTEAARTTSTAAPV